MLPLFFFLDEKGIIKISCTGFPNISGIVEGFALIGLNPDLPNPDNSDIKRVQQKIDSNPNNSDNYLEMAKLYEKSGNPYMDTLYKYEALIYGKKDPVMQKEIYDSFMKFGMYVEAFDTMAEGNFQNPADAEKHYYAGQAACRFGHPNLWNLNKHVNLRCNACQQSGGFKGKENILFARMLWFYYSYSGKRLEFGDPLTLPPPLNYQALGRKVLEYSDNFINSNPGISEPFVLKSDIQSIFGDGEEVYNSLKKAEKCGDFTAHTRAELADSASYLGRSTEGKIQAIKALKNSSASAIHIALARSYLIEGNLKKGEEELDKFLALHMWHTQAYELYSRVLYESGDKKKAKEYGKFNNLVDPPQRCADRTLYMDIIYPSDPSKRLNE
jgi:tetratricopeptide (TPR) repeat protein